MGYPTFDEALIYKSRTVQSQVRAAVGLDYPVFSGAFSDDFDGGTLDLTKWFGVPYYMDWVTQTFGASDLTLDVTGPAICPGWIQTRHNLAFPIRRDTDWVFNLRACFPKTTSYGNFIRICGRSFRDAEAVWALKVNAAQGLRVNVPDGYSTEHNIWSTVDGAPWRRYRVTYNADAQTYTCEIDQDDDGVYETSVVEPVAGRYADAIVIGNSSAIQGLLGDWTSIKIDSVSVTGVAEPVVDPEWAAPFNYRDEDGSLVRMAWMPTIKGGRISIDKDNIVDAAELTLDNFALDEVGEDLLQPYTGIRFLNRRVIVQGRAGDGNGHWTNWTNMFNGVAAEKQPVLQQGRCIITLPLRDRWRARADDMEVLAAYSDTGTAIPGVGMNLTVAGIIEDVYGNRCEMPAAAYNVAAMPNNIPRNYNIMRVSAQQAVKTIAEQAALAVYQRIRDARVEVQEWFWGNDSPGYHLSTAEELLFLEWSESAFEVTSAEQLSFENTEYAAGGFTHTWPPHREPFYGRMVHSSAVVVASSVAHDARPVTALTWWARNRKLGGVTFTAAAQLWLEHDLELGIRDDKFLSLVRGESWIVDGIEHTWDEGGTIVTRCRCINPHPDRFLRANLPL